MQVVKDWWENRVEIGDPTDDPAKITYKAKCYSVREIEESGYNLDLCKYPKEEEVILTPDELLKDYHERRIALDAKIDATLKSIQSLLSK